MKFTIIAAATLFLSAGVAAAQGRDAGTQPIDGKKFCYWKGAAFSSFARFCNKKGFEMRCIIDPTDKKDATWAEEASDACTAPALP
jgi:hypothetical protein